MSNLESKLEAFRRRAQEAEKRLASSAGEKQEEQPKPEPAAAEPSVRAEPVSARIGAPLNQATGSASQLDRSSVLAAPRPAPSEPIVPPTQSAPADEDIPEVEDYLPFLRDEEGTGDPKPTEKVSDSSEDTPAPHVQNPAPSVQADKPAGFKPNFALGSTPASGSSPRTFVPPVNIPSRDSSLPFEGTGQPRPLEKAADDKAEVIDKPEVVTEAEAAVKAESPAVAPETSQSVVKPYRITLKQPREQTLQAASTQEMADMWGRLPRHIQFLLGPQPKEVAQHSYKQFRETREELIQKLLDPMLSLEEAARILNVCPTTVRRYTNRGLLPHFRTAGNQRRFRLSDVLAFLETLSKLGPEEEEVAEEVHA